MHNIIIIIQRGDLATELVDIHGLNNGTNITCRTSVIQGHDATYSICLSLSVTAG